MKNFTLTLWVMVAITFVLWFLSKESVSTIIELPMRSFAQISALLGATGYFVSFILSSRLPFFEKNLPLDKSYKLHRIVGTLAGAGILLHVSTLITSLLPSPIALKLYLLPGNNLAYTMGIFAFYLLLTMLLTTLYLKLPYHIWKVIHKITSYSVLFASLHLFLIPSDISRYLPLRYWMLGIVFLGLCAWIYREFIYPYLAFRHEYTITSVMQLDGISVITMSISKNPVVLKPGQFAFFKLFSRTGKLNSEAHPFTVLTSTKDSIMLAAKNLGDYTSQLSELRKGDFVRVAGPHGSFGEEIIHGKRPEIWVAGGIGITPFFNLSSYFASTKKRKDISLFYATSEQDKLFHPLLLGYANDIGFSYSYHCSATSERITPTMVLNSLKETPESYNYFLCGPKGMLLSFIAALESAGVARSQIFMEDFDFKNLDV